MTTKAGDSTRSKLIITWLGFALMAFFAGTFVQLGIRAVEWLVAAPPVPVVVCSLELNADSVRCAFADDLIRQYREIHHGSL